MINQNKQRRPIGFNKIEEQNAASADAQVAAKAQN